VTNNDNSNNNRKDMDCPWAKPVSIRIFRACPLKKLITASLSKRLPSMGGLRLVYPLEAQVSRIRPGISPGIFTIIGMGGTGKLPQNPAKPRFFSPDLPKFFPPILGRWFTPLIIESGCRAVGRAYDSLITHELFSSISFGDGL
jgi:hypothetical protein